jgi:hypothetical protein
MHHMARYWQIRNDFLKDFTTQNSLIGSTFCTRSKKNKARVGKASSPSVFSEDIEISKTSAKSNAHDCYPKHLNHEFMLKQDLKDKEMILRSPMKKSIILQVKMSIKCQIIQALS